MTGTIDQGERALWLAVIAQHVEDATSEHLTGCTTRSASDKARQEARDWLTVPNEGFSEACVLAGLEADSVRKAALAKIAAFDASKPAQRRTPDQTYPHDGESRTIKEWAAHLGVNYSTLYQRLNRGLSIAEALTVEGRGKKAQTYTHDGKTLTAQQWSDLTGIDAKLIYQRLRNGMSFADAIRPQRYQSNAGKAGPFGFDFGRQAVPA